MPALILDAARTPFGRYRGGLSGVRVDDLAALPISELLKRHSGALDPARVDDVVYGNTNGAGEENRNVGRMAALLAGLPVTVPGSTVNRLCASGGEAVVQAGRAITSGDADLVIAGGGEGMSRAPFVVPRPERAMPDRMEMVATTLGWRLVNPQMRPEWTVPLGLAAERVAAELGIGRTQMDDFALRSHPQSGGGVERGRARRLRLPGAGARRGRHERARAAAGRVGALGDEHPEAGAAEFGLLHQQPGDRRQLLPDQRRRGGDAAGLEPLSGRTRPGTARRDPRQRGRRGRTTALPPGRSPRSAQTAGEAVGGREGRGALGDQRGVRGNGPAVLRHLPEIAPERVNVHGGAIAYGHPLGTSMPRVIADLCRHLRARGGGIGVAAACVGVGQGMAVAVRV